jgi:hypothetical protein
MYNQLMNVSTSLSQQLTSLTTKLSLGFGIGFIIIGTLGGILNILVFYRPTLRKTSCGIYFLAASIFSINLVLTGQLSRLVTLSSTSPLLTTFWYCQLRVYLTNSFGLITRGLLVMASLDRLLLCSLNTRTRAWCKAKIAIRNTVILILISFIIPLHTILSYDLHLPSRACYSNTRWLATYDISYQYLFIAIIPSGLMSIFSLMLVYRIRAQRLHLARTLRTRDKQLMLMLIGQVLVYIFTHLPIPINMTYMRLTACKTKTRDQIAIEAFVSFLINSELIYFYFSMTFFLHTIVSPIFRKHLIRIWKKTLRFLLSLKPKNRIRPTDS